MIKKILALCFATLFFITPVHALSIPKQDESIYVNDFSDVLSSDTEKELITINQNCDYETGGYVVVATFDFVEEDLYDFSYRLFNKWGIGSKEYNNGVLLVLDIGNDNYCYILGSGIEHIISDGEARYIIDTYMEPDFAIKDYNEAVLKTTKQFIKYIENEESYVFNDGYTNNGGNNIMNLFSFLSGFLPVLVTLLIIITILSSISRSRRYYRGGYVPPRRSYWHIYPPYYHRPTPPTDFRPRPSEARRPRGFTTHSSFGSFRSSFGGSSRSSFTGGRRHSGGSSRGAGGTRR